MITGEWTGGQATALREAMRLSANRFADRLGVSPRTVANWRADPGMVPRLEVQNALEDLLREASEEAKARFAKETAHALLPRTDEVQEMRDTIDNLSARLTLLERLIAGPPILANDLQATTYGGRQ